MIPTQLWTGSISTGKTTLTKQISDLHLSGVCNFDELARQILDENPGIEMLPDFQDRLFEEQTNREIVAQSSGASIITYDRGVIDNIAHARLFGQPVREEWIHWSKNAYSSIYVFDMSDIQFEVTDLQRKIDPKRDWVQFRIDLDAAIKDVIRELHLSYHVVCGTCEERLSFMRSEINRAIYEGKIQKEGTHSRRQERK